MITVEELKESLLVSIGDYDRTHSKHILEVVIVSYINAIIGAAEAKGEERARMNIWQERDHMPQSANERCVLIPVRAFNPKTEREQGFNIGERVEKMERFLRDAVGEAIERALDTTDDYVVAQRWRQEFGKAWYEYRFGKKEEV
jgi:ribosomal protein S24E